MRIDQNTLLFHDLSDDEAREIRAYGEAVMLRGERPEQPAAIQEWMALFPDQQPLLVIATVLPARIFYSLVLREDEITAELKHQQAEFEAELLESNR